MALSNQLSLLLLLGHPPELRKRPPKQRNMLAIFEQFGMSLTGTKKSLFL